MTSMGWLTMDVAIEGGIFLSGGVLATLYGYGVLNFTPDKAQQSEQTLKTLRFFRWGGPVLLCLAGSLLLEAYLR
jgi:hypothetical protein